MANCTFIRPMTPSSRAMAFVAAMISAMISGRSGGVGSSNHSGAYFASRRASRLAPDSVYCPCVPNRMSALVPTASRIYCVDTENAKVLWTFPDGGGLSAPAIANGRVYIGSGNTPFFYCLDAITGKPIWIHKFGQRVEESREGRLQHPGGLDPDPRRRSRCAEVVRAAIAQPAALHAGCRSASNFRRCRAPICGAS